MNKDIRKNTLIEWITSAEYVGRGHPDKLADYIADSIAGDLIKNDREAKTAIEIMITDSFVLIAGEIKTKNKVDDEYFVNIAMKVLKEVVGDERAKEYKFKVCISSQSDEINHLVVGENNNDFVGAGDQGIMLGYACDDTLSYIPYAYNVAKRVIQLHDDFIEGNKLPLLYDCKSLAVVKNTIDPKKNKEIKHEIVKIIFSTQIKKGLSNDEKERVKNRIHELLVNYFGDVREYNFNKKKGEIHINFFEKGGSDADTGLTGRKIIMDNMGVSGGGAFSGKDSSKVDRTGAYLARYIALNIVAADILKDVKVRIGYEIGDEYPTFLDIDTDEYATNKFKTMPLYKNLLKVIPKVFDLKLKNVIENFRLKDDWELYAKTAKKGHFDIFDVVARWENPDKADELKKQLKKISK